MMWGQRAPISSEGGPEVHPPLAHAYMCTHRQLSYPTFWWLRYNPKYGDYQTVWNGMKPLIYPHPGQINSK